MYRFAGPFIVMENLPHPGAGMSNAKRRGVKKGRRTCLFALLEAAVNYLAAEASPDAIAEADAEADAFLAFLTFFGLADASADAAAAEAAGAAAAAEAEAIAEAAKAEVANIEAIMTAINFFILVPRWVKKMVIRFESMPNNEGRQDRLTAFREKIDFF